MTNIRFIGDVHSKYDRFKKIIRGANHSIQVGDLGVGFYRENGLPFPNPPYDYMKKYNCEFIRGNHDNPNVCKFHSQWIPDGSIRTIGNSKMMFVGGAMSIDRSRRIEGLDWWSNEELSINELNQIVDMYILHHPNIMVTHDCPQQIAALLSDSFKIKYDSRTRQALESMFEFHKPEFWIFGHYHKSFRMNVYGTEFICLAELEYMDIEI